MYKMTARKIKFFAISMLLVGAFNLGSVFGGDAADAVLVQVKKVVESGAKWIDKQIAAIEEKITINDDCINKLLIKELDGTITNAEKVDLANRQKKQAVLNVEAASNRDLARDLKSKGISTLATGATKVFNIAESLADSQADIQKNKDSAEANAMADIIKNRDRLKWLEDPKNLFRVVGTTVGGIAVAYLLYQGIKISAHYVESHLDQPTLVRTSSQLSIKDKIKSLFKKEEIESRMSEIVIEPQIWEQLLDVAEETQKAKEFGDNLMNVMFYGPPGTGKTLFAKELALHTGLDFAMMSGADFSQFDEGKDIKELHKLFDWAEKSKKGLLIFVDEAEVFLADRGAASTDTRSKRLTDAFLSRVEKPTSKNLMFVFATNHPEVIDNAVLSRIGRQIKFDLPAITERTKILNLYFKKLLQDAGVKVSNNVLDKMGIFADQMDGFSPRQIETTVELMIKKARYKTNSVLTPEVANKVIGLKVKELKDQLAIKAK
jgi:ATPase family AAA domain-containing protein 3A/B